MNVRNLLTAATLGCLLVAATRVTVPAAISSAAIALPDCSGNPVVKPLEVVLTCADGGFTASKLRWTGWGSAFAAGVGIASVNDCKPYCAAGHFHTFTIVLLADGTQTCPNHETAYARVTYAFIGPSPYPSTSAKDSTFDFRCGPRT
ncbi:MAG: hypothetical protein ABI282_09720 [Candidatus Baltobacteraceae bacterium]